MTQKVRKLTTTDALCYVYANVSTNLIWFAEDLDLLYFFLFKTDCKTRIVEHEIFDETEFYVSVSWNVEGPISIQNGYSNHSWIKDNGK